MDHTIRFPGAALAAAWIAFAATGCDGDDQDYGDADSESDGDAAVDSGGDTAIDPGGDTAIDTVGDADHDADEDGSGDCVPGCDGGPCDPGAWATICAGTFMMGSSADEDGHRSDERLHEVTLTHRFEILSTEVTQGEFETLMGYNPSSFSACGGTCPVEMVNWHEAAAYCNALSASEGLVPCYDCTGSGDLIVCDRNADFATPYDCPGYRLPTEAEWEFAARAGTTTSTYNGDHASEIDVCDPTAVLDTIAWYCGNSGSTPHPVATLAPNAWGLFDMLGNVWEWSNDMYIEDYLGDGIDPWGPPFGEDPALRGGCWWNDACVIRAAVRSWVGTVSRADHIGIRPARTLP